MVKNGMELVAEKSRQIVRAQITLVVLGIVLLVVPAIPWWSQVDQPWREMLSHLVRDIGITFLISVVVTYLIELERDLRRLINIKSDTVNAEMAERVTPQIWNGLNDILQEKRAIRENVDISLQLFGGIATAPGPSVLELEYRYDLRSIVARSATIRVEHELDYQLSDEKADLPRFERIFIDGSGCGQGDFLFETDKLKAVVREGRFLQDLQLPERGHSPVVVYTARKELINIPGSYNLYMPEFCKGVRLQVRDCPPGLVLDVIVRPQGPGQLLKRLGNTWTYDRLMLPGQGLEIKFMRKTEPASGTLA